MADAEISIVPDLGNIKNIDQLRESLLGISSQLELMTTLVDIHPRFVNPISLIRESCNFWLKSIGEGNNNHEKALDVEQYGFSYRGLIDKYLRAVVFTIDTLYKPSIGEYDFGRLKQEVKICFSQFEVLPRRVEDLMRRREHFTSDLQGIPGEYADKYRAGLTLLSDLVFEIRGATILLGIDVAKSESEPTTLMFKKNWYLSEEDKTDSVIIDTCRSALDYMKRNSYGIIDVEMECAKVKSHTKAFKGLEKNYQYGLTVLDSLLCLIQERRDTTPGFVKR